MQCCDVYLTQPEKTRSRVSRFAAITEPPNLSVPEKSCRAIAEENAARGSDRPSGPWDQWSTRGFWAPTRLASGSKPKLLSSIEYPIEAVQATYAACSDLASTHSNVWGLCTMPRPYHGKNGLGSDGRHGLTSTTSSGINRYLLLAYVM